jgi:hypothetical protein
MSSWEERANGYWVDHDTTKGYVPTCGPFPTLAAAQSEFEKLPHKLRYRLRGPKNTVYAESNEGRVFKHDPPLHFKVNR